MKFTIRQVVEDMWRRLRRSAPPRASLSCLPTLEVLEDRTVLDDISASVRGINARGLQTPDRVILTGKDVAIGQLEPGRPGKPGCDNADESNHEVRPAGVYRGDGAAVANADVDNHAEAVAGVMIANGPNGARDSGVSREASLFASAGANGQPNKAAAAQHLATLNAGNVRAINLSYGHFPNGTPLDGSSLTLQRKFRSL